MIPLPIAYHTRNPMTNGNETKSTHKSVSPMRIVLKVVESGLIVSAPLLDRMVVGRDDSDGTHHIDIDLAKVDGVKYGMSRWHALFMYDEQGLFVEDLNSTNGTRINGYKIDSGRPFHLRNGDELELGSLRLIVQVVRARG